MLSICLSMLPWSRSSRYCRTWEPIGIESRSVLFLRVAMSNRVVKYPLGEGGLKAEGSRLRAQG